MYQYHRYSVNKGVAQEDVEFMYISGVTMQRKCCGDSFLPIPP